MSATQPPKIRLFIEQYYLPVGFALLMLSAVLGLTFGPVISDWRLVYAWFWPQDIAGINALHISVVTEIRLPRLTLGLLIGCVLAQAGTAMQTLCRNPLADPGLIGISAGAAVAALGVISLGSAIGLQGAGWVTGAAFFGAFATTLLVYRIAGSGQGGTDIATLLLAGVAINALAGALIGLFSYYADDDALRLMTFWQMGSLAGTGWAQLPMGIGCIGLASFMLFWRRKSINILLLGERQARYLGLDTQKLKREIIIWVALGVGAAVALAGIIGFIGLVIPHIARLLIGADIRKLMPVSMFLGAAMLTLSDWVARTLVEPAELPIGIITALIGGPFFIFLLIQQKRHRSV